MDGEFGTDELLRESHGDADIQRLRKDLPTLEAIERRRGQLWVIASIVMLAASAAVVLLVTAPDALEAVPDSAGVRFGFAGASVAFLLYVFDQERRLRRLADALVAERILSTALTQRVRDLSTLSRVGQVVNAVLSMREVLEVVLEGSFELTRATRGSVMLVEGDELVVSVSAGDDPAPAGARQPIVGGVAGWVATHREPLLITGDVNREQVPDMRPRSGGGGSSVCAPMLVADELLGVLSLERSADAPAFSEWDMRAVTLFASHAATAVNNSRRYEHERDNVERLATLVETRSEYVATMVHDLKAPLTSVIGFAKLVTQSRDLDVETRLGFVARIEHAAMKLLEMIDGVLEGASRDAQHDVRREAVDVTGLVYELADLTASMAQGRDGVYRPVVVSCTEPELLLRVDEAALRSILVNLLENAVKYGPPESMIEIGLTRSDREVRITVRDEGDGIPEEELATIFERFRQRDPAAPTRSGVGLGLYIVQSLATAHGGRVAVSSRVGQGTIFMVAFPDRFLVEPTTPNGEIPADGVSGHPPVPGPQPPGDDLADVEA